MRPLTQEFNVPLNLVERPWLRRSATLMIAPLIFLAALIVAVVITPTQAVYRFISDCW